LVGGTSTIKLLIEGENRMFGTKTDIEPPYQDVDPAELIPLSQLALDLPAPAEGWPVYLHGRNIPVVVDDIGRDAISRDAARRLFTEHRENLMRVREVAARREAQAIALDQARRAQLNPGVPWYKIPAGVSPAQAMAQAGRDAEPRRVSPTQEWLDQIGQHAVQTADES
jgi:hypothetical protein